LREITPDMRGILIDWLVEVAEEFRLEGETLFLCVHYIDRYLSRIQTAITRGKLQLLGITALLIASKYEEIYVPTIQDIVYIADNTYTKEEVLAMEINLLNTLRFDIAVCTVKRFVQYFLKTAEGGIPNSPLVVKSTERRISNGFKIAGAIGLSPVVNPASTLEHLANYLAELSLVHYRFAIGVLLL